MIIRKSAAVLCALILRSLSAVQGMALFMAVACAIAAAQQDDLDERPLAVRDKGLSGNQPYVAEIFHALSGASWLAGKNGEAEELFKRTLAIRERALGESCLARQSPTQEGCGHSCLVSFIRITRCRLDDGRPVAGHFEIRQTRLRLQILAVSNFIQTRPGYRT
jgi:hypothetical protein